MPDPSTNDDRLSKQESTDMNANPNPNTQPEPGASGKRGHGGPDARGPYTAMDVGGDAAAGDTEEGGSESGS